MAAGETIDFCIAPGSTFGVTTGDFTFMSQDAQTYPPGTYTIEVVVTAGIDSQIASFQLTLTYPSFTLAASPFAEHTQVIGDLAFMYNFDVNTLA